MVANGIQFSLLVVIFYICFAIAQFPASKAKYFGRPAEVPFIVCDVCERGVRHLAREIKDQTASKGKLDEDDVLSIVEKVCNTDSKYGNWIEKYDIVEEGDKLKLIEHNERGKCREECKTIAKACEESIAEVDTDIGELLWRQKYTTSQLINKVCREMTVACLKKPGKFQYKREDEKYVPMSKDEQKANDMMKEMRGVPGMPGMEMYSKEDIEKMRDSLGEDPEGAEKESTKMPEQTKKENKGSPGFLETVQAVAGDIAGWFKRLFGYSSTKSEL